MALAYLDCKDRKPSAVFNLENEIVDAVLPQGELVFSQMEPCGLFLLDNAQSCDAHRLRVLAGAEGPEIDLLAEKINSAEVEVLSLVRDVKTGLFRVSVSAKNCDPSAHLISLAQSLEPNKSINVDVTVGDPHETTGFLTMSTIHECALTAEGNPRVIAAVRSLVRGLVRDLNNRRGVTASEEMSFF